MSYKKHLFADFFRSKIESDPDTRLPPREPQLRGWLEEYRVEVFQTPHEPLLLEGVLWSKLAGSVYKIERSQLSVVLAHYEDNTILWLDDHSDDTDFKAFVRREQLSKWLPQNREALLDVLIATKFNFLGRPQLVRNPSEIPTFSETQLTSVAKSKGAREKISEQKALLARIQSQIQPPNCVIVQDQNIQLDFCIWAKILGRVIKINCFFGTKNDHFLYKGVQLAEQVGNFLIPS